MNWRTFISGRSAAWVLGTLLTSLTSLTSAPAVAERAELETVPRPATEAMDPGVRAQLAEHRELLDSLGTDPATPPGELANAYALLGRLYYAYRLYEAAGVCFGNAHVLTPGDARWSYLLALCHIEGGRVEDARETFEATLELDPTALPAWLNLGELLLTMDRVDAAREAFGQALALVERSAAAHYGLGRCDAADGELGAAVERFEKTLELEPEADVVHYSLALAHRGLGQLDQARSHLRQRGTRAPSIPDPLLESIARLTTGAATYHLRATRALRQGALEEAIAWYKKALAADPDDVQTRLGLAAVLERSGDPDAALEQYRAALAGGARDPKLYLNLGVLFARLGSSDEALRALREAVLLAPDFRDAHFNLGLELKRGGQLREAAGHLTAAVKLDPRDHGARLELAAVLGLSGRGAESLALIEAVLAEAPGHSRAHLELALALGRLGRFAAAAAQYTRFLELDPTFADAHLGRAMALLLGDRCVDARQRLDESARLLPADPRLRHLLARVLATCPVAEGRDGALALALATRVLREQSILDHVETLAMAYAELDRFAEAAEWQRRALAEAERRGWNALLPGLRQRLALYERGEPCREPWKQ